MSSMKKMVLLSIIAMINSPTHPQPGSTETALWTIAAAGSCIATPYLAHKLWYSGHPSEIKAAGSLALGGVGAVSWMKVLEQAPTIATPQNAAIALTASGLLYLSMETLARRHNNKTASYWKAIGPVFKYGLCYGAALMPAVYYANGKAPQGVLSNSALFLGGVASATIAQLGAEYAEDHLMPEVKLPNRPEDCTLTEKDTQNLKGTIIGSVYPDSYEQPVTDTMISNQLQDKPLESDSQGTSNGVYNVYQIIRYTYSKNTSYFAPAVQALCCLAAVPSLMIGEQGLFACTRPYNWSATHFRLLSAASFGGCLYLYSISPKVRLMPIDSNESDKSEQESFTCTDSPKTRAVAAACLMLTLTSLGSASRV